MDRIDQFGNAREVATLLWTFAVVVAVLVWPKTRHSAGNVLGTVLGSKLALFLGALLAWLIAAVCVAARLGLWTRAELLLTAVWFAFTAPAWFGTFAKSGEDRHFILRRLRELVGFTVLFELFVNTHSFGLLAEMFLAPWLVFIGALAAVAQMDRQHEPIRPLLGGLALITIAAMLVKSGAGIIENFGTDEFLGISRSLAMPVWLALAAAPFVYLLGVYSAYEQLALRLRFANGDSNAGWPTRLGLASALRLNLVDAASIPHQQLRMATEDGTFSGARHAVARFRAERAADLAARSAASQRLVDNAGIDGVDACGRRLDRREFKETKESLEWLAVCISGHFRNRNRFREDILSVVGDFERHGLAEPHGINLMVTRKGGTWYAYRRTVTGWVFGIGAVNKPESAWWYDGAEPPPGPPGKPAWSDLWDETRTEWREEDPNLTET